MFKILLQLLLLITSVTEVPNPRLNNTWISDTASMLSADVKGRIDATLTQLSQDFGVEIALVTVDDVSTTPKEFATALFNHWGIGKSSTDNGLLILMVRDKRRLEMETGYGLEEALPDSWLGSMQLSTMVPAFKRGDYGAGLEAGINAIDDRLRHKSSALPVYDSSSQSFASIPNTRHTQKIWTFVLLGLATAVLLLVVSRVKRYNRRCHPCGVQMDLVSESEEDQHLTQGQQFEERIRSVLYDVYQCPRCASIKIIDENKWFSGYSRCYSCNVKAATSSSTTLIQATYDHGGTVQVSENCAHCGYHNSYTRSTPQLTRSSSSSSSSSYSSSSSSYSSGSSSFGGGSSGGGGAGSSW